MKMKTDKTNIFPLLIRGEKGKDILVFSESEFLPVEESRQGVTTFKDGRIDTSFRFSLPYLEAKDYKLDELQKFIEFKDLKTAQRFALMLLSIFPKEREKFFLRQDTQKVIDETLAIAEEKQELKQELATKLSSLGKVVGFAPAPVKVEEKVATATVATTKPIATKPVEVPIVASAVVTKTEPVATPPAVLKKPAIFKLDAPASVPLKKERKIFQSILKKHRDCFCICLGESEAEEILLLSTPPISLDGSAEKIQLPLVIPKREDALELIEKLKRKGEDLAEAYPLHLNSISKESFGDSPSLVVKDVEEYLRLIN